MLRKLKDILEYKGIIEIAGSDDVQIKALTLDSRQVKPGTLFFAVKGTVSDGHTFIPQAIASGATGIVCSEMPSESAAGCTYILVDDVQQSAGFFASAFYGHPSAHMKLLGVTGTNGKTSTCTMLYYLYTDMGYNCGLISTVEYVIGKTVYTSTHTTPDPLRLNALLHEMREAGCSHCFMEVSSHALVQGRVNGLSFTGGVFTNITHDHLDYHKTFDNYIRAKKLFFDRLGDEAFALSNRDDKNGMVMLQNTRAVKYTYAISNPADFKCKIIESDLEGLLLKIDGIEIWFGLVGRFNAYNLLAVYATAFLLGADRQEILTRLSAQGRVNGRFEVFKSRNGITGIVDYAHTPDALENVLATIQHVRSGNEQLICVVGCGGNRDREKRPLMGRVAARMSNRVILTSDNPRDEDPEQIMEEMMAGIDASDYKKVLKITDRKEAIRTAVMMSRPGDIILLAGKGHETYQEIKQQRYPFDDREILKANFKDI